MAVTHCTLKKIEALEAVLFAHVFSNINVCQVPRAMLKTEGIN